MNKLFILLFIFLPAVLFGQEDLKKSAEDFLRGYYKLFEEKKWDLIMETYAKDAQVIWMNGNVSPLAEAMKPELEKYKKEVTSEKIDVKWIVSDITGPSSAQVVVNYIETNDRSGNIQVQDDIEVYLLEQIMGVWKIKKWFIQHNLPLIYSANIDTKYRTRNPASVIKARSAIDHWWGLLSYLIEHNKEIGVSPDESGKIMGARFAMTWNPSDGFEALASGFTFGLQIMSPYVEVLERNETTFKAKILSPTINDNWKVTEDDLFICTQNIWEGIADYMGGVCSLSKSDKYWIITMTKK